VRFSGGGAWAITDVVKRKKTITVRNSQKHRFFLNDIIEKNLLLKIISRLSQVNARDVIRKKHANDNFIRRDEKRLAQLQMIVNP